MRLFNDIAPASIKADSYVLLKEGRGGMVRLVQADGSKLMFQTPLMNIAWDTRVRTRPGMQPNCAMGLVMGSNNPRIAAFEKWLNNIRDHLKQLVMDNSQEWTGKQLTDLQVDEYMPHLVKQPDAGSSYAPTFTPKVPFKETADGSLVPNIKVFSPEKELLDPEMTLLKGTRCSVIVEIPYLFISKTAKIFSIRCDITQCLAIPVASTDGFSFDIQGDPDIALIANDTKKRKAVEDLEAVAEMASVGGSVGGSVDGDAFEQDVHEADM